MMVTFLTCVYYYLVKVFRYLPIARLPADQLVLCSALAIVWLITVSCSHDNH